MKKWWLILGMLVLFAGEILRVYFIMPFPGSQKADTINIAWFLHKYIFYIRIAALLLIVFSLIGTFFKWRKWGKIIFIFFMALYAFIFYLVNYKFLADKMFYQPKNKMLVFVPDSNVDTSKLVIGISINGQADRKSVV